MEVNCARLASPVPPACFFVGYRIRLRSGTRTKLAFTLWRERARPWYQKRPNKKNPMVVLLTLLWLPSIRTLWTTEIKYDNIKCCMSLDITHYFYLCMSKNIRVIHFILKINTMLNAICSGESTSLLHSVSVTCISLEFSHFIILNTCTQLHFLSRYCTF